MLDIINKDDYRADTVHKNLVIELDDGTTIDNTNIKSESMKLNEILMDGEQLKFGRCNSSQFGITLGNIYASLKDKVIKPYLVTGGNEVNKSAEGNPITVTDSGNYPLKEFKEDGYIQQKTLSGKNLFSYEKSVSGYLTGGNTGGITSATATKERTSEYINVENMTELTFQVWATPASGSYIWWAYEMYDSNKELTLNRVANHETSLGSGALRHVAINITIPEGTTYIRVSARLFSDGKIQLEKGSTATDYESYCGGIPSPNPDYPQDIKGLGDDGYIEVTTTGKNIFGGIALANALKNSGSTNVVVDEEAGTVQFGHNTNYKDTVNRVLFDKFKENTQYTFVFKGKVVTPDGTACNSNIIVKYTDGENKRFNFSGATDDDIDIVFTTPSDKTVASINYGYSNIDKVIYYYNECGVFEGVITEAEFEPYQSSSANISIDTPLYEGDYIEYFADGTGQIVRDKGRIVFNGTESWTKLGTSRTDGITVFAKTSFASGKDKANTVKSTHFTRQSKGWVYLENGKCNNADKAIGFATSKFSTIDEWKTWLQSNPITVVYELAEPIITPLTAEQIAEIEKLMTFEGSTRITNNDNANMTVKYKYNKALPLGVFTVKDVPRLSQTPYKQITALDNMHKIDRDVTEWYNNLTFPMTQKAFRDSFFEYIGLEQVETELLFDDLVLDNPFADTGQINGRTIAEGLCELNATFGHCDREGRFKYVSLKYEGLYPDEEEYPSDDTIPGMLKYPSDNNEVIEDLNNPYIKASYDEFETQFIERILVIDDYGSQLANSDDATANTYVINNNYLLYGRDKAELLDIMNRFQSVVRTQSYRPTSIDCKGLPYVELGDRVRVNVKDDEILTYVFNRTLTGIQALRDTYSAEGEEYLINDLNSIQVKMDSLNRKTDRLKIEVTATAKGLESKVSKGDVSSEISQEADQVSIKGNRFVVEADNLSITKDGKLTANEAVINGTITSDKATITNGQIDVLAESGTQAKMSVKSTDNTMATTISPLQIIMAYNNYLTILNSITGGGYYAFESSNGSRITQIGPATLQVGASAIGDTSPTYFIANASGVSIEGNLAVSGTKSRQIETSNYADRLEYCYEMPTPYFGDIGEGITDSEGICYIFIDDIFAETIDTNCEYQVFLQSYGVGNVYVSERNSSYFVVKGTANMKFAWELKAVQRDYEMYRLDEPTQEEKENVDYAQDSYDYLSSLLYDVESEVIIYE